jgi:glycosyltransferase involved in cell wall biosynthesis
MIRVGYVLEDHTWLGGVNYYVNLFSALAMLPNTQISPVMFVNANAPADVVERLKFCRIVKTSALDRRGLMGHARRGIRRALGGIDPILRWVFGRDQIDVLSHSTDLLWPGKIKTIGWIPDFQHLHLPSLFSARERSRRDREYARIARNCDLVVLSSADARRDFARIAPEAVGRTRVLRFVPEIDLAAANAPFEAIRRRYGITSSYFFLPNQFWVHKNHTVVVEALGILKQSGVIPLVLATGNVADPRNSAYFESIMRRVRDLEVEASFRVLGVVPYGDMISLMRNSIAVINPSLFEGWSSTVEEAKILDKRILLSNLEVHREQNPDQGLFFDPHDPRSLADLMHGVMSGSPPPIDLGERQLARYDAARRSFGREYADIVAELFDGVGTGSARIHPSPAE